MGVWFFVVCFKFCKVIIARNFLVVKFIARKFLAHNCTNLLLLFVQINKGLYYGRYRLLRKRASC